MSKSKGPLYYAPLVQRIEEMDASIKDMKMKIERIRVSFCEHDPDNTVNNPDEIEEICPDEVESELAVMEIMKEIYMEAILDEEPEGEA